MVGELQREFINGLEKDLNRLQNRLWDEYSIEILKVSNWYERYWLRNQVKRLKLEHLKVLGATLQLDEESAREMMGYPSHKSKAQAPVHAPSTASLAASQMNAQMNSQALAQMYGQAQNQAIVNSLGQSHQGHANLLNSNGSLGRP